MEKIITVINFIKKVNELVKSRPQRYFSMANKDFALAHPQLYRELQDNYNMVYKTDIRLNSSKCSNCFLDKFFELRQLKNHEIMERIELLHKMREGFVAKVDGVYYSSKSKHLTNEACEKIYKKFGFKAFESYDKNWRSKVAKYGITDIEKAISKESIKDFFEDFEEEVEAKDYNSLSYQELLKVAKEQGIKTRKKHEILKQLK